MKNPIDWLDPYHQSFLFFRWNYLTLPLFILAVGWTWYHVQHPAVEFLLDNPFIYFPNYFVHEFSHRIWCSFKWEWWCYASGNIVETLVPLAICLGLLGHHGGRYALPPMLYWLSTTLYGAGIYAADARASALTLTSSDMLNTYAPGVMKGDWYYILQPLGYLDKDVVIGQVLIFCAVFVLVLAVWSAWYYWAHPYQYIRHGEFH